jgi:glycosyltransferase involved in cell wall biosynthesis
MRIAFVITGMETGGAEMMLLKVVSRLHRDRYDPFVVSLREGGDMAERFRAVPVPLYSVGMSRGGAWLPLAGLFRLFALMRRLRPDVLQGWMYHGNVAAQCAALILRRPTPVLWNVRAGANMRQEKRRTRIMVWLGGRLSHLPDRIINNSVASAAAHEHRFGYRADKRLVIPNGFDTEVFRPSDEARATIRAELGLPESATLVGLIGRYRVEKNHIGFLHAAAALRARHPDVVFVLAGAGVDEANAELRSRIRELQLGPSVRLLGRRDDMPRLTAALDVLVCCSLSEGFPNVVGEAMSCGVPCVVADVGDCAWVVGEAGKVVPPRDTAALAAAMHELVEAGTDGRRVLGQRARQRVIDHFSLDAVVAMYESAYESVANERERKCAA